jgi:formyltetrahydrofolate deformylase
VAAFLHDNGCNIVDSAQYGDPDTKRFFMRVQFSGLEKSATLPALKKAFAPLAARFGMEWRLHDAGVKPRVLIMVSKFDHCLHDLLYRYRIGELVCEITSIVSNHRDTYRLAASYDVPFHHLPVTEKTKAAQEAKILNLVRDEKVDLVVLARYMQILSKPMCEALAGRAINIHHSFLPSFKGARPYSQAHERGVKLIGATAHYVTSDLDEGPIIEQAVERVTHGMSAEDYAAAGRDIESAVLARAVRWHAEHRILINGRRTVVFY